VHLSVEVLLVCGFDLVVLFLVLPDLVEAQEIGICIEQVFFLRRLPALKGLFLRRFRLNFSRPTVSFCLFLGLTGLLLFKANRPGRLAAGLAEVLPLVGDVVVLRGVVLHGLLGHVLLVPLLVHSINN